MVLQLTTSLRQMYATGWATLSFLGMVGIALVFVTQNVSEEARQMMSARTSNNAQSNMDKTTAMILTFTYAALCWTLSNGIVTNPRQTRLEAQ